MTPYEYEVVVRDHRVEIERQCRQALLFAEGPSRRTPWSLAACLRSLRSWIRPVPRLDSPGGTATAFSPTAKS